MENNIKSMYMYNWITLLHNRNEYNIVNQLCFNKNIKTEKKKPPKTKKNHVQWTQIVIMYWQLHLLRYLAVCFIDMFLCLIFMVLGLFKFKCSFILFFAVMLSAAVHGIQMTRLCNRKMYIGQGRPVVFPHELRTHASLFKPYDINLGFSEPFSCYFLVCIAGGSWSWNLELEEVGLGLFPWAFLLVPGEACDSCIHHSS